jgi:hypothetical protein
MRCGGRCKSACRFAQSLGFYRFFLHEPQNLCHQVVLGQQARTRSLHAGRPLCEQGFVGQHQGRVVQAVPGGVEVTQRFGRLQPVQKGEQLVVVCVVVLRVDLPDQRPAGPQRAHQRIFAAHQVQVAGPEHLVKGRLGACVAV